MIKNPRNLYTSLLICIAIPVLLTGCGTSAESFDKLMEQLDIGCGETGEVSISTSLDVNPAPLINSNTNVIYTKKKEDPDAGCEAPVNE